MRSQYTYIAFLTTSLFVTLTSQPASGFNITPSQSGDSDRTYLYQERYEEHGGQGIVKLDAWPLPDPRRFFPEQVLEIKPGARIGT